MRASFAAHLQLAECFAARLLKRLMVVL